LENIQISSNLFITLALFWFTVTLLLVFVLKIVWCIL